MKVMKKIKKNLIQAICIQMLFMLTADLTNAAAVSTQKAKVVAENFLKSKSGSTPCNAILHYQHTEPDGSVAFYVFNFISQKGFVIVTGDDRVKPVIAYSTKSSFDISIANKSGVIYWMNKMQKQIQGVKQDNIQPGNEIAQLWNAYLTGAPVIYPRSASVGPLLTTIWNQGAFYNSLCPSDGNGGNCPTGCVATAMAQIMKYWNYPPNGTGSYEYIDTFGSIQKSHSVNFGNTNYNWSNMPDTPTTVSKEIATLMYHCGVSVEMEYEISGSSACVFAGGLCSIFTQNSSHTARDAFEDQFGYEKPNGLFRNGRHENWINILKDELDLNRPILYTGYGASGVHAWVIDGYDNSDFFHMNWGWGGTNDEYYDIDNFHPQGADFDNFEGALIEIRPANLSDCNANFILSGTQTIDYYVWQASDYIKSTKSINNKVCTYTAGNYIVLNEGFEASGSNINLTAIIQQCITPIIGGDSQINTRSAANRQNMLSVFPNPANDFVNILFNCDNESNCEIQLLDATGRLVKSYNSVSQSGENHQVLDLEYISNGIYLIMLKTDDVHYCKKFIKL